jgi:hypothetical protein
MFNKHLHKHRGPGLSQPKRALLMACAASNAKRVGDHSWSRRMKRLKGWRRQRLRDFEQQVHLTEMRATHFRRRVPAKTSEKRYQKGSKKDASRTLKVVSENLSLII